MKPDDIPQDVWHRAEIAVLGRIYGGQITQAQSFRVEVVALEIMAAVAEERESCATIADEFELENDGDEAEFVNKHSGANWDAGFDAGCTLVGRAIRNRSN